jgi:hypothetical protein
VTTVDVGDAFEIVFTTTPGATVLRSWYDPNNDPVIELDPVAEDPPGSGQYPYTFRATAPGMWTARVTVSGTTTAVEEHYVYARAVPAQKPLAATGHVAEQFGALTSDQEVLVKSLIRAASAMIRARLPLVDAMIADGRLNPDLVALAITNMILRVLRNPSGLRSEAVGPFSRAYDTKYAAGQLVLGEEELGLLTPVVVDPSLAPFPVGTAWVRPGMAPLPYGIDRGWI